jgi:hypothetical protein
MCLLFALMCACVCLSSYVRCVWLSVHMSIAPVYVYVVMCGVFGCLCICLLLFLVCLNIWASVYVLYLVWLVVCLYVYVVVCLVVCAYVHVIV